MIRHFGWKKDLPDADDHVFSAPAPVGPLPRAVSLRYMVPRIFDQQQTSSCVANAWAAAIGIREAQAHLALGPVSRLYIYAYARGLDGDEHEDQGTYLRSGAKALRLMGAPPEDAWPFVESRVNFTPNLQSHMLAHARRGGKYARIAGTGPARVEHAKAALAAGQPFVFGTEVTEAFKEYERGVIARPTALDSIAGGHALCAVGYDDDLQAFEVQNSWGSDWGNGGFLWMSYDYMGWSGTDDLWSCWGWQALQGAP